MSLRECPAGHVARIYTGRGHIVALGPDGHTLRRTRGAVVYIQESDPVLRRSPKHFAELGTDIDALKGADEVRHLRGVIEDLQRVLAAKDEEIAALTERCDRYELRLSQRVGASPAPSKPKKTDPPGKDETDVYETVRGLSFNKQQALAAKVSAETDEEPESRNKAGILAFLEGVDAETLVLCLAEMG